MRSRQDTFSNVQLALPFDRTFENSSLYFHIERIRQFCACITSAHREKNSRCIDNPCSPYIRCKDTCMVRCALRYLHEIRAYQVRTIRVVWLKAACLQNFRLLLRVLPARGYGGSESDVICEIDEDVSLNRKLWYSNVIRSKLRYLYFSCKTSVRMLISFPPCITNCNKLHDVFIALLLEIWVIGIDWHLKKTNSICVIYVCDSNVILQMSHSIIVLE